MNKITHGLCVVGFVAGCGGAGGATASKQTTTQAPAQVKVAKPKMVCAQQDRPGYKNLTLCTFADPGQPNTLTQAEIEDGWVLLFDGETLKGWRPHGSGEWKVVDGVLTCEEPSLASTSTNASGRMLGWIGTDEAYRDFELKLQYRLPKGGDSGVSFRTPETVATWQEGYEVQLLDDAVWPKPSQVPLWERIAATPSGSVMFFKRAVYPEGTQPPPADRWNDLEIKVRDNHIRVLMNGVEIVNEVDEQRKHDFGYIGLQYYFVDSKTEFRNIKLRVLYYGGPLYGGEGAWKRYQGEKAASKPGLEAAQKRAEKRAEERAKRQRSKKGKS